MSDQPLPHAAEAALPPATCSALVWQPVNIPEGRKKWIEVRSKSWVTETGDGCHVGYRGKYLGVENKSAEECMAEIGAMLECFSDAQPNGSHEPRP